ncbi:MAG TPA: SDR family NAD(P)-dependent oxidoreductase [Rhizomicrobium sp.]|jgi:short-subunit dehydrogenase|nr:SDR family NAD(P)-dependent oxidoreductase [Rhizomicrobium sp.]
MTARPDPPRHVLITGASSGIGAALARSYARPGVRLSLTARSTERLQQVAAQCGAAGAETALQTIDICDAAALPAWIEDCDTQRPVDLVIANAGVGGERVIATSSGETLSVAHDIVATNILGVANTVIPLLPRFVARGKGHVVIMSSLAAYIGLPQAPLYSASKAAIRIYGQGLRRLLEPKGVQVTVICPGFVDTPMSASVPGERPLLWTTERAARRIVAGLARGERDITFPWPLAALARVANLLPARWLDSALARRNRT